MTFTGSGFQPGENVRGTVHSDPVDLGVASSWDLGAVHTMGRISAIEASADGLNLNGTGSRRSACLQPMAALRPCLGAAQRQTRTGRTTQRQPSQTRRSDQKQRGRR